MKIDVLGGEKFSKDEETQLHNKRHALHFTLVSAVPTFSLTYMLYCKLKALFQFLLSCVLE